MSAASTAGAVTPPMAMAPRWPRLLLLVAAAIELMSNLPSVAVLFGDTAQMAGAMIIAKIALAPLVAFAALFFAVRGPVAYALLAFAALILLTWASFLPAFRLNPPTLENGAFGLAFAAYQLVLAPLIAAGVVVLALSGKRPVLATLLAVLPTPRRGGHDRLRDRRRHLRLDEAAPTIETVVCWAEFFEVDKCAIAARP